MLKNISKILDSSIENKWFIEDFMWFYDKQILLNMFYEYGSLFSMISFLFTKNKNLKFNIDEKFGIFEIVLYYAYLYNNAKRFGYKIINVNDIINNFMSVNEYDKYYISFISRFCGACGILEHTMLLLTEANWETLANMFKTYNFNIIRCDYSDFENIELQEKFMGIVKPNILAASQEHAFGINDKYKILVDKNKYFQKMEKHLSRLLHPQKFLPQLFIEPFSIIYYYIMNILYKQKNIKKYEKLYGNKK
jgi:hypothetical protein